MKYQTYPAYKPSGVEWLGDVPEHWEIVPLKYLCNFSGGGTPSKDNLDYWTDGDIPWVSPKDMKTSRISSTIDKITEKAIKESSTNLINEGALLIVVRSGILQHSIPVAINDVPVTWNQDMKALQFNKRLSSQYAMNVIVGNQKSLLLEWGKQGATVESIEHEYLANTVFPIPLLDEQQKIAQFLDHETAKIDTLIEKQQRLIELLKEKRQAVISHAVTKGLNPNAPMKPSGVEWLGDVPEHWIVCKLKHIKSTESNAFVDGPFGSNLKSEHFIEHGDVYVIESNFATTGKIDISNLKKISQQHFETIRRSSTKYGDIILAKIGARYGSSSILPSLDKQAVVSGNSLKLTVNPKLMRNEYANELLRILKANDAMDEGVNVTAQPALSLGGLNNLPFLKIPLVEQNQIIDYVKNAKYQFDKLVKNAELFIGLAHERRTALISAAVTGKIDVRDWGD